MDVDDVPVGGDEQMSSGISVFLIHIAAFDGV